MIDYRATLQEFQQGVEQGGADFVHSEQGAEMLAELRELSRAHPNLEAEFQALLGFLARDYPPDAASSAETVIEYPPAEPDVFAGIFEAVSPGPSTDAWTSASATAADAWASAEWAEATTTVK